MVSPFLEVVSTHTCVVLKSVILTYLMKKYQILTSGSLFRRYIIFLYNYVYNSTLYLQINDAADDKDLKDCILDECDTIVNAGYSKPLFTSTQADKVEIVKTLKLYYTLLESLAEI